MNRKPKVGDIVRLNDTGMQSINGLRSAEEIRQAQRMVITFVSVESLTEPEQTWEIQVDQPLIDQFLLTHDDVDLIQAAP